MIVDWFCGSAVNVAHQRGEAAFALAGEQRHAEIERFLKIGGKLGQH